MQVFDLKSETMRRLAGRNLYLPHPLMLNSGMFWRCAHGNTGLDGRGNWEGCNSCQTGILAYDAIGETTIPQPVAAALLIDGKYCDPSRIDGDYSHWMPRKSSTKPKAPIEGKVHAAGVSKEE